MEKLFINITQIYGAAGQKWLQDLSDLIVKICLKYNLNEVTSFPDLTFHYVAACQFDGKDAVLKLGPDIPLLTKEAIALKAFAGHGAVTILAQEDNLLILTRANPGFTLEAMGSKINKNSTIRMACDVMKKLHNAEVPASHSFPHINDWLTTIDNNWPLPAHLLAKARKIINNERVCGPTIPEKLLHGDLHRSNILADKDGWIAIDPKGVIGAPIHETWAFVKDMEEDLSFIANHFNYPLSLLQEWYFVHLIRSCCWCLEDKLSPEPFLCLAERAYGMI